MEILTQEETLILTRIADGIKDEAIAEEMNCSRATIRNMLMGMFRVTNTPNRYALIAWGFRNGYLN